MIDILIGYQFVLVHCNHIFMSDYEIVLEHFVVFVRVQNSTFYYTTYLNAFFNLQTMIFVV